MAKKATLRPGIGHRYPDRLLFLATDYCSSYCRYCTRTRMVGWIRPFAGMALAVTKGYEPARIFYQKHSYRKACTLVDFYRPGDHKIIFIKKI